MTRHARAVDSSTVRTLCLPSGNEFPRDPFGRPRVLAPPAAGLVYGVACNVLADHERGSAPHRALSLYLKPFNTHVGHGAFVTLPDHANEITVGATLGLVIGTAARRLDPAHALDALAGVMLVLDLALPIDDPHRPPIGATCFDGACPMGPWIVELRDLPALDRIEIRTVINRTVRAVTTFDRLVRPIPQLLADVTAHMTLHPGDVLLAGLPIDLPRAHGDDIVAAESDGLGRVEVRLAEGIPP